MHQEAEGDRSTEHHPIERPPALEISSRLVQTARSKRLLNLFVACPSVFEVAASTLPYIIRDASPHCVHVTKEQARDNSVHHSVRRALIHRVSHLLQHPLVGIM